MIDLQTKINECSMCGDFPKLTKNSIKFGKSKLLVLGESPAMDGWITGGKPFYNKQGQLQASGRNLQKLLSICNLTIDDINFTECCKCVIIDRTKLRKCIENCKPILMHQLKLFNCDVILPMGQYPTEAILGEKINRLKDYVGKEFYIDFGAGKKLIIPIYHPSPVNPQSIKGNMPIFEKLKKYNLQ